MQRVHIPSSRESGRRPVRREDCWTGAPTGALHRRMTTGDERDTPEVRRKDNVWEVDIRILLPDGSKLPEPRGRRLPASSRSAMDAGTRARALKRGKTERQHGGAPPRAIQELAGHRDWRQHSDTCIEPGRELGPLSGLWSAQHDAWSPRGGGGSRTGPIPLLSTISLLVSLEPANRSNRRNRGIATYREVIVHENRRLGICAGMPSD